MQKNYAIAYSRQADWMLRPQTPKTLHSLHKKWQFWKIVRIDEKSQANFIAPWNFQFSKKN